MALPRPGRGPDDLGQEGLGGGVAVQDAVLGALLVFVMRVTDVSLGTIRIVMLVRGRKWIAGALGFCESLVWVLAAGLVLTNMDSPLRTIAFAGGFATGTVLGGTIEGWIAMGQSVLRVITPLDSPEVAPALRMDRRES